MKQPLDSYNAFQYILRLWRLMGLHPPETTKRWKKNSYTIYAFIINIFVNIWFQTAATAMIFTSSDLKYQLSILPHSIASINGGIKHFTIAFVKNDLHKIKVFLERLDSRAKANLHERIVLENMIKFGRKFSLILLFLYSIVVGWYIIFSGYSKKLITEQWFPFDYTGKLFGYAFIIQSINFTYFVIQMTADDSFGPCYIYLLLGHIRAFNLRISKIGKNKNFNEEENYEELLECIKDHEAIVSMFEIVHEVISRVTFTQYLVTAAILCMSLVKINFLDSNTGESLGTVFFFCAISLELLPCCWVASQFVWESSEITSTIFECNWIEQNIKFRKTLLMFMQKTQKNYVFISGRVIPLSNSSMVSIFRFTFSLYTVLASVKELRGW